MSKKLPPWTYKGKTTTVLPHNTYGFIYCITFESGKMYIGQKKTIKEATIRAKLDGSKRDGHIAFIGKLVKLTAEELAERPPSSKRTKKSVQFEKITTPTTAWKSYKGSSKDIPANDKIVEREILYFSSTKRTLTYLEAAVMFSKSVLFGEKYYNKNILGRFYDNSLNGLIKIPK